MNDFIGATLVWIGILWLISGIIIAKIRIRFFGEKSEIPLVEPYFDEIGMIIRTRNISKKEAKILDEMNMAARKSMPPDRFGYFFTNSLLGLIGIPILISDLKKHNAN